MHVLASKMSQELSNDFDVSQIEEGAGVTVHGVVVDLSPIKSSRTNPDLKYFSGKLSDGKTVARMISFHPQLRPSFEESRKKRSSIAMVNCTIKEAKYESGLEIVGSSHTLVQSSPKKFKLDETLSLATSSDIPLSDVPQQSVSQLITVVCKVVKLSDICDTQCKTKILKKQECIVSDHSDTIRVVLWENDCGKLQEGKSYRLSNFRVREYASAKYLSMTDTASTEVLEDIGDVVNCDGDEEGIAANKAITGTIIAVFNVLDYASCIICPGKLKILNAVTGECEKCKTKCKLSRSKKSVSAKFLVEDEHQINHRLTAFNDQVSQIIDSEVGDTIEDQMLLAPRMKFFTNANNIVQAINKT